MSAVKWRTRMQFLVVALAAISFAVNFTASQGVAGPKLPLTYPTGTWKVHPIPNSSRPEFSIIRGRVTLKKQGTKLVAGHLTFTIPADSEYSTCPFLKVTNVQMMGTVIVPRQKVPKSVAKEKTAWDGWRRAHFRIDGDSQDGRVYFFFPGNGYGEHPPGPEIAAEVGGCQYRGNLRK